MEARPHIAALTRGLGRSQLTFSLSRQHYCQKGGDPCGRGCGPRRVDCKDMLPWILSLSTTSNPSWIPDFFHGYFSLTILAFLPTCLHVLFIFLLRIGAAIVVDVQRSSQVFSELIFNPQCFLLNRDVTLPPSEWDNVSKDYNISGAAESIKMWYSNKACTC